MSKTLKEIVEIEGDEKDFQYKGYQCRIRRVGKEYSGHLCGYIVIPQEHQLYKKEYDEIEEMYNYELPSHRGLTFSDFMNNEYWIGFDCAHAGDLSPFSKYHIENPFGNTYRTIEYVQNRLTEMVDFIISHEEVK